MDGLIGKVAIVTGAGAKRSMGRAIAMQLAEDGADVVAADKSSVPESVFEEDKGWGGLEQVAADVRALGRRAAALLTDVSSESDVERLFKKTASDFGAVDIVVHCVE